MNPFDVDMRKWTERRIAFWTFIFAIPSFLISTGFAVYFSHKTNQISQKSFCIDKVSARLDDLNSHLYEIPKFVSGCSISPKSYCNDARSKVAKVRNVSFQMGGLLSDQSMSRPVIDDLTTLLNDTELALRATDGSNGATLVQKAHEINLKRRDIAQINAKKLTCLDLSE